MSGRKSPLSSKPTTPTGKSHPNNDDVNYGPVNPLFNPTPKLPKLPEPFESPLSSEPTTPTGKSNAFINSNEPETLKKDPLYKDPKKGTVTLYKGLPEPFLNAMKKHGTLVKAAGNPTMGAGRRRTKYKRAKKRSHKSKKKSKVIV